VIRIAPNPSRFTVRSPPTSIFAADVDLAGGLRCRPLAHGHAPFRR
jgi:hypothetical protein